MNLKEIEKRIKKAVAFRESGLLGRSRKLFESIISEIEDLLKNDSSEELKNIYVDVMGQYVIQYRLEAKEMFSKAVKISRSLLEFDIKNTLRNPSSYRALAHSLTDLGLYEQAEMYLRKVVKLYKGNIAKESESKAHLAYCLLRLSRLEEAQEVVDEALAGFENKDYKEQYFSVWFTIALMFKALILNAQGNRAKAIKLAHKAFNIAKKDKRVFRVKQAQQLVDFLENEDKEKLELA